MIVEVFIDLVISLLLNEAVTSTIYIPIFDTAKHS